MSSDTDLIDRPIEFGTLSVATSGEIVERASEIATALKDIIQKRRLWVQIGQRQYVYCEAWTTLGAMLGAVAREVETHEAERTEGEFVSTVEAVRTSDGMVIGRASASCGPDEKEWSKRSRQARRSMAQTRATSKVFRLLFSWVMNLAGYEATPAEEMEGHESTTRPYKEWVFKAEAAIIEATSRLQSRLDAGEDAEEALASAEARLAQLSGEIAKRDATDAEREYLHNAIEAQRQCIRSLRP